MQTTIPSTPSVLSSLLRADFTTQWRNRRSVMLVVLVPVVILISWKGLVAKLGGTFVLSNCITIGLNAIGLMGYSNAIARDRDKGVFQRLRVAPVPSWSIMISRLLVQLAMIFIVTTAIFVAGVYFDKINLSPAGYVLGYVTAIIGGAVYLALGQAIVGLIKNPETVNAVTRLTYFIFIMIGMFGELGMLGHKLGEVVRWSPYGTVKRMLSASMEPSTWNQDTTFYLLATIGYTILFTTLGIKWFKWNTR
ncbi:MAG: ABC transporter permease [Bacteroidota bacterium]|nr:ABC transporter permease [Bacteroidota bacterium]